MRCEKYSATSLSPTTVSHANDHRATECLDDDAPADDVHAGELDVTPDGKPTNKNAAAESGLEARTTRNNPDGRTDNLEILPEFPLRAGPRRPDRHPQPTRTMPPYSGIPAVAGGIGDSAPDDVPGLGGLPDTAETRASDANNTPLVDTPNYSNVLAEMPAETTDRTLSKGINASPAGGNNPANSLDQLPRRQQTDRGPSEPVTLLDYASGRRCKLLPEALSTLPLDAPMQTASGTPRRSIRLHQPTTQHIVDTEINRSRNGLHHPTKLVTLQTAADSSIRSAERTLEKGNPACERKLSTIFAKSLLPPFSEFGTSRMKKPSLAFVWQHTKEGRVLLPRKAHFTQDQLLRTES